MSNLIESFGYVVIAFISCLVIFFCGFKQFDSVVKEQKEYNKKIMSVQNDGINTNKSPIFTNCPTDEMYLTISNDIKYNWDFLTKNISVQDYKGIDIKNNLAIRLYRIIPDELNGNLSNYVYLGSIDNKSNQCLFSMDNYNININDEIIITDNIDNNNYKFIGYNTYITSGLTNSISNKYKLVYSVIDNNGYKAEYSIICIMENKDIMDVRNINIHTPIIANNYNSITELKDNLNEILLNTYATITDNTNDIIQNLDCDIDITLFNTITLVETECIDLNMIDNISNNTIIRVFIKATDSTTNKTINKNIELFYSY